jgi:exopolyphosphatase/guanosine-5'-triphosphate,3'-diphosphate pyrophosphatase
MVMAQNKMEYGSVHGAEVYHIQVVHLLANLLSMNLKERREVPGLQPERADIIVAGVAVVEELMRHLKTNLLKVNERGIREGLILKGLKRRNLLPAENRPRNWRDSILEYARSCYHSDTHPLHVTKLALEIFDVLAPEFKLGRKKRQLLEAAALLHDVGYSIRYSDHHKHTYHLIRHSDLFGFTPREREIIAQVGRYHRKSLPRKKHDTFARLATKDRLLVKRLGGIVRLADGLDRRRRSMVTSLDCSLSPSAFRIILKGEGDVSVELFGGRSNGDLFETAFDRKLVLAAA